MPFNPVNMFNFNKPRNQPSPYPFPTTYLLAVSSLIASSITFVILVYFSYYLRMDNMAVPAQFIFVRRPFFTPLIFLPTFKDTLILTPLS
jgi:hypothetical protein